MFSFFTTWSQASIAILCGLPRGILFLLYHFIMENRSFFVNRVKITDDTKRLFLFCRASNIRFPPICYERWHWEMVVFYILCTKVNTEHLNNKLNIVGNRFSEETPIIFKWKSCKDFPITFTNIYTQKFKILPTYQIVPRKHLQCTAKRILERRGIQTSSKFDWSVPEFKANLESIGVR